MSTTQLIVYEREIVGFQGPPGSASGTIIRSGAGVPSNSVGQDGDYWINETSGDLLKKIAGAYAVVLSLKGDQGDEGDVGPAWTPPFRTFAGAADTPTAADHGGLVAYTGATDANVTINHPGEGKTIAFIPFGTGMIQLLAGSGVTLTSGNAGTSRKTPRKGSVLSIIGGPGLEVFVNGDQA